MASRMASTAYADRWTGSNSSSRPHVIRPAAIHRPAGRMVQAVWTGRENRTAAVSTPDVPIMTAPQNGLLRRQPRQARRVATASSAGPRGLRA
jgi:hypothetical protein